MKIIKIIATRCQILRLMCTKFDFGCGSAPDPAEGAYSKLDLRGPIRGREGKGSGKGGERDGREGKTREGRREGEKGKGWRREGEKVTGNGRDKTGHGMGRGGKQ